MSRITARFPLGAPPAVPLAVPFAILLKIREEDDPQKHLTGLTKEPWVAVQDAIIKRAKDGDREAQREIYDLLIERVHRLVGRIVGNSDVDDVTQDVFINVFAKLGSFRQDSEFSTWVHRLAVNDALQHLRRRRFATSVGIESVVSKEKLVSDQMEIKEMVDLAFSRIDPDLRSILELKDGQKLSYSKIADIVGVPIGTIGSRLNRARRELHHQLTALGWEG